MLLPAKWPKPWDDRNLLKKTRKRPAAADLFPLTPTLSPQLGGEGVVGYADIAKRQRGYAAQSEGAFSFPLSPQLGGEGRVRGS